MPAKPKDQASRDRDKQDSLDRQAVAAVIGKRVIDTLGHPEHFHDVQVQLLWDGHYRVNVLVGEMAVSVKVGHSYFVVADDAGNIITCTPSLVRRY